MDFKKLGETLAEVKRHEKKGTMIYYVPDDGSSYIEEMKGYRIAVVKAGGNGYQWTGQWPNDGTRIMPYFFGPSLVDAQRRVAALNLRFKITEKMAAMIIVRSMVRSK